MEEIRRICLILALICLLGDLHGEGIPVVLDTDVGSDIDDTWALLYLLKSPELDLKMVLTDTADTTYRGKVAAKFLEACGRSEVPIGLGIPFEPDAEFQMPYVVDYSLDDYSGQIHTDGVAALIDLIHQSEIPVKLICIGPVPNIAEALERDPSIARKVHFIGMHGSVDVGYNGAEEPSAEWNVASNIPAFRKVLSADWLSFKITPLDTCGHVIIGGDYYQSLKDSTSTGLVELFENYRYWVDLVTWESPDYYEFRSSTIYDIVPIYMAYGDGFLKYENLSLCVDDEGIMRRCDSGANVSAALEWNDLDAFYDHFTKRLLE